jgi:hypothetical protein
MKINQNKIDAVEKLLIEYGVSATDAKEHTPRLCEVLSEYYQTTQKSDYSKQGFIDFIEKKT